MLACPRCGKSLDTAIAKGGMLAGPALHCAGCKVEFPQLGDVPFMWAEPQAALADWRNRWNFALAQISHEMVEAQSDNNMLSTTTARLDHLRQYLQHYQDELADLLGPLGVGQGPSEPTARQTHLALRTRLPRHHHLLSYMANVHRDWSWGDEENRLTLDVLLDSLATSAVAQLSSILVLGAGSGRLAYDLHQHLQPDVTYAVDSNPLLCLIGSRVTKGAALTLTEFPLAPINPIDCAVPRKLTAPSAIAPAANAPSANEGLTFICADAMRAPFIPNSFDLVVTPWLIDVIDAPAKECSMQIARMLSPGGHWLNHGSIAFDGGVRSRLTVPEVHEVATNTGFEMRDTRDARLPYLHSPASRQQRYETTHTFTAELTNPPSAKEFSRFKHLPDWIVLGKEPIPLSPSFETQITTTRIHAFIMSLIDGKRSIGDLAEILEGQKLMSKEDAAQAIRNFLITMYEEAARSD
jgi:SAM-dependent methyltransferase